MTLSFYRRNLPHWQPQGVAIFLTWRLHGSLPKGFVDHLRKWNGQSRAQFLHADRMLDTASSGPVWLKDPEVAAIVDRTIRRGAELAHYVVRAYVIMPNHVHLLLEPLVPLHKLTSGIKGVSATTQTPSSAAQGTHSGKTNRSIIGSAIRAGSPARRHTSRTIP